jgi:dihydropyrimidinase
MTTRGAPLVFASCALALATAGAQQPAELIIRNGLIVTAEGRILGDVRIRGEQVADFGANLAAAPGGREIDAKGMILMPGAGDTHTHLNAEPPQPPRPTGNTDDYVSGSAAAFAGGATTLSNFVAMVENETPAAYAHHVVAAIRKDGNG